MFHDQDKDEADGEGTLAHVGSRAGALASSLFGTVMQATTQLVSPERPRSTEQQDDPYKPQQQQRARTIPETSPQQAATSRPVRRMMRPIRPPPLAALQLKPTSQGSCFLSRAIAEEIRNLLPQRLQVHDRWQCIYNLNVHGVSLGTLYHHCFAYRDRMGERPGFVVAVQDRQGQVFGGYVNEYLRPEAGYYGNGECFLWKVQTVAQPGPASDHSGVGAIRFKAYPWTGMNDYQLYCTPSFISFGGGNGKYGLWLDDRLELGVSGMTETFGNEPLCDGVEEGRRFGVVSVEVWKV